MTRTNAKARMVRWRCNVLQTFFLFTLHSCIFSSSFLYSFSSSSSFSAPNLGQCNVPGLLCRLFLSSLTKYFPSHRSNMRRTFHTMCMCMCVWERSTRLLPVCELNSKHHKPLYSATEERPRRRTNSLEETQSSHSTMPMTAMTCLLFFFFLSSHSFSFSQTAVTFSFIRVFFLARDGWSALSGVHKVTWRLAQEKQ